jgi:hypothetical protein
MAGERAAECSSDERKKIENGGKENTTTYSFPPSSFPPGKVRRLAHK